MPNAEKGKLDLSNWDFEQDGNISMNGEWEFYQDTLLYSEDFSIASPVTPAFIKVPSAWNKGLLNGTKISDEGFGTYRLLVQIDSQSTNLSIKMMTAATAMDLFVDGKLIYQQGKVGKSKATMVPQYLPGVVTFQPLKKQIEIIVHVSNFFHRNGGLWEVLHLGAERKIYRSWLNSIGLDLFIIGCIFIVCTYHLLNFFFQKNYTALYFSIFCLLVIIRILSTGECLIFRFLPISWFWVIRLDYLSFYGSVIAFIIFFRSVFSPVLPKKVSYWVIMPYGVAAMNVLFLPPIVFTYTTIPIQILTGVFAAYFLYLLYCATIQKIEGSVAFLLGFIAIYISFINDALFANDLLLTGYYSSIGILLFILTQNWHLSKSFSNAFNSIEKMNATLIEQNMEIETQNETLKNLNNELDVFVYRTSHDLRAPLASVLGLIDLCKTENNINHIKSYLDLKEKTIKKLDSFISDILYYSRNSRTNLEQEEINFDKLVHETLSLYSHYNNYDKIKKIIDISQQDIFLSDEKRLSVIFNNLISNAIRYSNPYSGESYLQIKIKADAEEAKIEIKDNGVGIEQKHIDKIFDIYFRANQKSSGSGLGLFLVKETVNKLEGSISVASVVNEGTSFYITLPNMKKLLSISSSI